MTDCLLSRFDSEALRQPERMPAWTNIMADAFTTTSVGAAGGYFRGQMDRLHSPLLNLARVSTTAAEVQALGRSGRERPDETVLVHLQLSGKVAYEQNGRRCTPRPNSMALCVTDHPYKVVMDDAFGILALTLRAEPLRREGIDPADLAGMSLRGEAGPGAALSTLLRELWTEPGRIADASAQRCMHDTVVNLLVLAIEWENARGSTNARICEDVQALVARHLAEPELDVHLIARRLRLSSRQIQRMFAQAGTTPRQYILERRLDAAAVQLRYSPATSITEIAYATGMGDLTYFGRSFRRRFGLSPSEYRELH